MAEKKLSIKPKKMPTQEDYDSVCSLIGSSKTKAQMETDLDVELETPGGGTPPPPPELTAAKIGEVFPYLKWIGVSSWTAAANTHAGRSYKQIAQEVGDIDAQQVKDLHREYLAYKTLRDSEV